jgi:predicted Rossmann fold flavoprotein
MYDTIVVGAGASGIMAAIILARENKKVLLVEQSKNIASKLKATGGGRCNLSNTLSNDKFVESFGRNGRFISDAIEIFDHKSLMEFFASIGVQTHIPDGFRIFPTTHNSSTIIEALSNEIKRVNIELITDTKVDSIVSQDDKVVGIKVVDKDIYANSVVVATGGLGYPILGASDDGHRFAKELGHKVTDLYPAMTPLNTKESWVANCKADTIAKATIKIDHKKAKNLKACGDLIFTSSGIRGPVVLDFAREITPFLDKYSEVELLINMTSGMNESEIIEYLKDSNIKNPSDTIVEHISKLLPLSVSTELVKLAGIDIDSTYKAIKGESKNLLIKYLAWTPLTVASHQGYEKAMITRGGVSLKDINPKTMQSKKIKNLYFCGEVVDIDGPCGGYNLQWAFSSGYLVAKSIISK